MDRVRLAAGGIDVDDALSRLMNNEQLLARVLTMFLDDDNMAALEAACAAHDKTAAEATSHTLKGLAGNLSITPVYEASAAICDDVRAGEWERAVGRVPHLRAAYNAAQVAIREGI